MKKTILITGSTDGIGNLAARMLAEEGHTVLLHGRNEAKLLRVMEEIKQASTNEALKGYVADFSNLEAVQQMAHKITQEVSAIDVLINNAGVFKSATPQVMDGLDIRFVVNYLAPYLLTNTLLPALEKGDKPRVINVSSAAQAPVSLKALAGETTLAAQEAYAQSKLAITMWTFYMAQQHPGMMSIAVNPGSLLNTNMVREAFGRHWSPASKGGEILRDLAILDVYRDKSGQYFDNDRGGWGEAHADAYQEERVSGLLAETKKLIGKIVNQ